MAATFELDHDTGKNWRWRLRHTNGRIIAESGEGYEAKAGAEAATESALARAAARWGTATVVEGGTAAEAAPAAASAASVAVPIAVGVYVTIAVVDLFVYASFQHALRRLGYVILPAPLVVCIGLCHRPAGPTFPAPLLPAPTPMFPRRLSPEDLRRIRECLEPTPTLTPTPVPVPPPREEEERRRDCRLVRRTVPRGDDPLSELFCQAMSFGAPSYDIFSIMGVAEIDALVGRTWYECKCGYGSLIRAAAAGVWWARFALDRLDEQIRRHSRIAAHCRLTYRFVVATEEVARFVRERHPDIDVVVFGWEPCE